MDALEDIKRLQQSYVEAIEKEDDVYQDVYADYIEVLEGLKSKIRKESMRNAKAVVTHCLFPEILRPVNGTSSVTYIKTDRKK